MREKLEKWGISWGVIVPILWMLRISSRGLGYWFSPDSGMTQDNADQLNGTPVDRNFFIVLEVLGLIILFSRRINWAEFFKRNKILILLFIYMGISVLWSDYTDVSMRRYFRGLGDLIMVLVLLTEINYTGATVRFFRVSSFFLVLVSVFFIKYLRDLGVAYEGNIEMWIGVTTHKNSLGQLACVAAFFLTWVLFSKYYRFKLWDIPIFALTMWLLNGSATSISRTSMGVYVSAVAVLVLLRLLKKNVTTVKIIVSVLVFAFALGSFFTVYFYHMGLIPWIAGVTGGDPTLTGRTQLWDALLEIGSKHWLQGSGYGGFWLGSLGNDLWEQFGWHPNQAHDGYIDVYVEFGIVGLILLGIYIIVTYRDILRNLAFDSDYGRFRLTMLTMVIIYNVTESSFCKPTTILWFLFLLISIKMPEPYPEGELGYEKKGKAKSVKKQNRIKRQVVYDKA